MVDKTRKILYNLYPLKQINVRGVSLRKIVAATVISLTVIALLCLPNLYGAYTQRQLSQLIEAHANDIAFRITLNDYQHGWFRSSGQVEIEIFDGMPTENKPNTMLYLNLDISHGPFIFKDNRLRFGSGYASLDIPIPVTLISDEYDIIPFDEPFLSGDILFSLVGNMQAQFQRGLLTLQGTVSDTVLHLDSIDVSVKHQKNDTSISLDLGPVRAHRPAPDRLEMQSDPIKLAASLHTTTDDTATVQWAFNWPKFSMQMTDCDPGHLFIEDLEIEGKMTSNRGFSFSEPDTAPEYAELVEQLQSLGNIKIRLGKFDLAIEEEVIDIGINIQDAHSQWEFDLSNNSFSSMTEHSLAFASVTHAEQGHFFLENLFLDGKIILCDLPRLATAEEYHDMTTLADALQGTIQLTGRLEKFNLDAEEMPSEVKLEDASASLELTGENGALASSINYDIGFASAKDKASGEEYLKLDNLMLLLNTLLDKDALLSGSALLHADSIRIEGEDMSVSVDVDFNQMFYPTATNLFVKIERILYLNPSLPLSAADRALVRKISKTTQHGMTVNVNKFNVSHSELGDFALAGKLAFPETEETTQYNLQDLIKQMDAGFDIRASKSLMLTYIIGINIEELEQQFPTFSKNAINTQAAMIAENEIAELLEYQFIAELADEYSTEVVLHNGDLRLNGQLMS